MPRALYSPFTLQAAVPGDRRAVFFMLDNLEHWHDLANTMPASAEIVLLDSRANALQDMAHYLAGHRGLEVIHLLSHGAPGRIELGALSLCSANLAAQSALLADIGRALQPGGDWLIYGCEVARGEVGQGFVETLARLAQVNVAASRELTGHARHQANWALETRVGAVDASRIWQAEGYDGVLGKVAENFNSAPSGFDPLTIQPYHTWIFGLYKFTATYQGSAYNQVYLQTGVALDASGVAQAFGTGTQLKVADIQPYSPVLLTIERLDGGVFSFLSLDVFNNDDNSPTTVKGLNGASTQFSDTVVAMSGRTVSHAAELTRLEVSGRTDPMWSIGFLVDNFITQGPDSQPTLLASGKTSNYLENGPAVDLFQNVQASTQDEGQSFTGLSLTVSNVTDGSVEQLSVNGQMISLIAGSGVLTGQGNYSVSVVGQTVTLTLSNLTRTDAQMNQLIDGMSYRNSSEDPTAGPRVVTLTQLTDSGATSNTLPIAFIATVSVAAINDAPTLSATGAALIFNKGAAQVELFSAVTVSTVEQNQLITGLSLTVTHVAQGSEEQLIIDGMPIPLVIGSGATQNLLYSVVDSGPVGDRSVTLKLSGNFSASSVKSLLESMAYLNSSLAPTPGVRTVTLNSITDNGDTANGGVNTTSVAIHTDITLVNVVTPPSAPVLNEMSDTGMPGDGLTSVVRPQFDGTAPVGSTVTLYLNEGGPVVVGSVLVGAWGSWSITPSQALGEGTHSLYARVTDAGGTQSANSGALIVTIDSTPPAGPVIHGVGTPTNSLTPTVKGIAEVGTQVTLFDSAGNTLLGSALADGAGNWSITTGVLSVGAHTLTAMARDAAGNISPVSGTQVFNVSAPDTTPPTLVSARLNGTQLVLTYSEAVRGNMLDLNPFTLKAGSLPLVLDGDTAVVLGTTVTFVLGTVLTSADLKLTFTSGGPSGVADLFGNHAANFVDFSVTNANVPVVVPPSTPAPSLVDGVAVDTQVVVLPGGQLGTLVSVPVVTADRVEQTGSPMADIPLVSGNGNPLLLAQVPVGYGLSALGAGNGPASSALDRLAAAINGVTDSAADQAQFGHNAQGLFNALLSGNVLVQTLTPIAGATVPGQPLLITGTTSDSQHTGLVIDATQLPAGSSLTLNAVDFAAVVGELSITGNTMGQVLSGDAASQSFTVTAPGSLVFSGGGDDLLIYQPTAATGSSAGTLLHGGVGNDTGVFSDVQSAYLIEQHAGYMLVTHRADPGVQVKLVNIETLDFADGSLAVPGNTTQSAVATLYQQILGRQADGVGFEYWNNLLNQGQINLGQAALDMAQSTESTLNGFAFNGQTGHDLNVLFRIILGRDIDPQGLAYWSQQYDQGQRSLVDMASDIVASNELVGRYLGPQDWDFVS